MDERGKCEQRLCGIVLEATGGYALRGGCVEF